MSLQDGVVPGWGGLMPGNGLGDDRIGTHTAIRQLSTLLSSQERRQQMREASERQFPSLHLCWSDYACRFARLLKEAISNGSK
jgi:hypothetical protein